ncbi:MAG: UDP-N-acetylmuramate--L-alanine ligase [Lachnospiraceae bacterium]|nr:UDP-N-acetylmuramate--L-alanine ligase [Lachnospiraceae bacterium]
MGIGGISMSSLARFLLARGFRVSGSDKMEDKITLALQEEGIRVVIGQGPQNITEDIDFCVHTAAVHPDNPEYAEAARRGLPILTRAQLLGQIMAQYPNSFGIAGTHGKTTTTGMVTQILLAAEADPTVSIGGLQESIGGNLRIGRSSYFVAEACEYTNSYHEMFPRVGIILNVKEDHLDFFGNMENIRRSFRRYAENIPAEGVLIVESDIEEREALTRDLPCRVVTVGEKGWEDYSAQNLESTRLGLGRFDFYRGRECLGRIELDVPGEHNITNALAAGAAALEEGIPFEAVKKGLEEFKGVHRRFEKRGILREDIVVMDDFGHHPEELLATWKVAHRYPYRLTCIFQPYTYSRTRDCFDDFVEVLSHYDRVVLSDIMPARETDDLGVHSSQLRDALIRRGVEAWYFPGFDEIVKFLLENSINGDMLITTGCGNVDLVADALVASDLCTSSTTKTL